MTASRHDPPGILLVLPVLTALAALPGCRAGLPPDPPGVDPVNANADIPPYRPPANPYETSAFVGTPPPAASGHEGHGNMHHGASPPPTTPATPSDNKPTDHSGHAPTPAKPQPMDHSAHTGKSAAPTEPRR